MKRATLERLAAVLVLAACICVECIPLLLALVAAAALCVGLANSQSLADFRKKKDRRCSNTRRSKVERSNHQSTAILAV